MSSTSPINSAQPQSTLVHAHDNASFSVTVSSAAPLNYQWSFNGTNITGATSSSLTISNVSQDSVGVYTVAVTNSLGSVTSSNVLLSMYPFVATPFLGLDTYWGYTNTLSVVAWGSGPLSYQWFKDGIALLDGTNSALTLLSVQASNAGMYSVIVSNPFGSVTNAPAQVVVNPAGVSLGLRPSLTIEGVVGYNYVIQSTTDIANTNCWATVTTVTLQQPVQLWVDTNTDVTLPSNPHRYYRVVPGQ